MKINFLMLLKQKIIAKKSFKAAFSLIEMLIVIIVISMLLTAFIPLTTKKIRANNVNIGSYTIEAEGNSCNCLNGTCASGKNYCTSCNSGYKLDGQACVKNPCTCSNGTCKEGYTYCTSCNAGYSLYEGKCYYGIETVCNDYNCSICKDAKEKGCTACKNGYVLYNGECYLGTTEGCSGISYDTEEYRIKCSSCKSGYTKCGSGSCRLTSALKGSCPYNTTRVGCICVTNFNIGEGYYGENIYSAGICTPSKTCPTASLDAPTCWEGISANTSGSGCKSCTGSMGVGYHDYSGCKRTVCNYQAAEQLCKSIGMRLPMKSEIDSIIADTIYGYSLTMTFCDGSSKGDAKAHALCPVASTCYGANNNKCYPYKIWVARVVSETASTITGVGTITTELPYPSIARNYYAYDYQSKGDGWSYSVNPEATTTGTSTTITLSVGGATASGRCVKDL